MGAPQGDKELNQIMDTKGLSQRLTVSGPYGFLVVTCKASPVLDPHSGINKLKFRPVFPTLRLHRLVFVGSLSTHPVALVLLLYVRIP